MTVKQIIANRKNSKLGGVKTPKGKEISKYNAQKHGLLTKEIVIEDENKKELKEFSEGLVNTLQPQGELEIILTEMIASDTWRLKRCLRIEKNQMEFEKNRKLKLNYNEKQDEREGIADMMNTPIMDRIMRYEASAKRSILKSLHELQRLQAKRMGESVAIPLAIDIEVSDKK